MRSFIIGIAGGSGSGKTSFIKRLRAEFSENELCLLSLDEYYKPLEQQFQDDEGIENFDLPKSIDKKAFRDDIEKLAAGHAVERDEYLFNNLGATPRRLVFKPAPILVVEGLFIFHYKKIKELLDLKLFIDAKDVFKVARRIRRDAIERGYDLQDVIYRFENHVGPSFEQFIAPYRDEADLVINNNETFERAFEVVAGFIKMKIGERAG